MKRHSNSIVLYHSSTVEVAEPQWDFAAGTDSERNDFGLVISAIAKLLEHDTVSLGGAG
jgi:hypothetical protein